MGCSLLQFFEGKVTLCTKAVQIAICYVLQADNGEGAEKETPASVFSSSAQVSCPLCDQGFPLTKIEQHAMYCNGVKEQGSGKGSPGHPGSHLSLCAGLVILCSTMQGKQTALCQS
jgi:hypothetical protein